MPGAKGSAIVNIAVTNLLSLADAFVREIVTNAYLHISRKAVIFSLFIDGSHFRTVP